MSWKTEYVLQNRKQNRPYEVSEFSRRHLRFLMKPPDSMLCSVCDLILDERVQGACKHPFCLNCSEYLTIDDTMQCPFDGIESQKKQTRICKIDISDFSVYCKNWMYKCNFHCKLSDIHQHEFVCPKFKALCGDCGDEFSVFELRCHVCGCDEKKKSGSGILKDQHEFLKELHERVGHLKSDCAGLRNVAVNFSAQVRETIRSLSDKVSSLDANLEEFVAEDGKVSVRILISSQMLQDALKRERGYCLRLGISAYLQTIGERKVLNVRLPVNDLKITVGFVIYKLLSSNTDTNIKVSLLLENNFVHQLLLGMSVKQIEASTKCRILVFRELLREFENETVVFFKGKYNSVVETISSVCKGVWYFHSVNQQEYTDTTKMEAKRFLLSLSRVVNEDFHLCNETMTVQDSSGSEIKEDDDTPQVKDKKVKVRFFVTSEAALKLARHLKSVNLNACTKILVQGSGEERVLEASLISTNLRQYVDLALEILGEDGMVSVRFLFNDYTTGAILGKGGGRVRRLQNDTKCRIDVSKNFCPESNERWVRFTGWQSQVLRCVLLSYECCYKPMKSDVHYVPKPK